MANGCTNARTIARGTLEARVLTGLRERMMTPDMAAEAIRAYAQETSRLNRERRNSADTARMSDVPPDVPDIHPGIAGTYGRRIERLTDALSHPDDAVKAAEAIREIIDRIVIMPGPTRRELSITLQGELGTILDWIDRTGKPGYKPTPDTASIRLSTSVKARGGGGRCRLAMNFLDWIA